MASSKARQREECEMLSKKCACLSKLTLRMLNEHGWAELNKGELIKIKPFIYAVGSDLGLVDISSFVRLVPKRHGEVVNTLFGFTGEEAFIYTKNVFGRNAIYDYLLGVSMEYTKGSPTDCVVDPVSLLHVLGLFKECTLKSTTRPNNPVPSRTPKARGVLPKFLRERDVPEEKPIPPPKPTFAEVAIPETRARRDLHPNYIPPSWSSFT